ncbi:MAG: hypothetical protein GY799_02180 [Desulfobulbaceae bacterium]|nr:hypothetical protein [Desulfobulbaceae bacterium]
MKKDAFHVSICIMISDTSKLPDDPAELKKIIADLHEKQQHYSSEIELLREQVSHLYNKLFGRKSEKDKYAGESPQLPLFVSASATTPNAQHHHRVSTTRQS